VQLFWKTNADVVTKGKKMESKAEEKRKGNKNTKG
jgi:hypothetical protein